MIWFTSDTLFNCAVLLEEGVREYSAMSDMNEAIIENWNACVAPKDTVYHLGGWGFTRGGNSTDSSVNKIMRRLNGSKILIAASSDRPAVRESKYWNKVSTYHELETNIGSKRVLAILSAYPMSDWPKRQYGAWMLHGYSKGKAYHPEGPIADVGQDVRGFRPVSASELIKELGSAV